MFISDKNKRADACSMKSGCCLLGATYKWTVVLL